MSSKLDYLKKYLAKPGGDSGGDVKKAKKDKARKNADGSYETSTLKIRDMSEFLPASKESRQKQKMSVRSGKSYEDEDIKYVDAQAVEEAQKVDVEKSGVAWKISQHRTTAPAKQALNASRVAGAVGQAKVIKEEDSDDEGGDLSPPRAKPPAKPPAKPAARKRHDSDSDISPPREIVSERDRLLADKTARADVKREADSDLSPPRASGPATKPEPGSDDDLSPPRAAAPKGAQVKKEAGSDEDLSPPRGRPAARASQPVKKEDSDADLSPPRQAPKPKARARHDSDDDMSPPRKPAKKSHDSDEDLSPPRKAEPAGKKKELWLPEKGSSLPVHLRGTKKQRHDSDDDLSPPRAEAKPKEDEEDDGPKMSSGLRSGLVSGASLKKDAAELRAKRKVALEEADDADTGRNALTVYRARGGDNAGKMISREEFAEQSLKKKKKKMSEYPEQELEWGGGVKQKENAEEQKEELSRIAAQPFARYEPDEKYVKELQSKQNWADPIHRMAAEEEAEKEKAEKEAAARKAKPKCPHQPWMNRHNIPPGYRWDGKIRGTQFEAKYLENKNHAEFRKKEAWMQGEMGG